MRLDSDGLPWKRQDETCLICIPALCARQPGPWRRKCWVVTCDGTRLNVTCSVGLWWYLMMRRSTATSSQLAKSSKKGRLPYVDCRTQNLQNFLLLENTEPFTCLISIYATNLVLQILKTLSYSAYGRWPSVTMPISNGAPSSIMYRQVTCQADLAGKASVSQTDAMAKVAFLSVS